MTYHDKKTGLASVAALAVGALVAFSASPVSALTLHFSSTDSSTRSVSDNDTDDLDKTLGVISLGAFDIGGFRLSAVSTTANDFTRSSELSKTSLNITGGAVGEKLTIVSESDFSGGADAPNASNLFFSLGGASLGGDLTGYGDADGTETSMLSFNTASDGKGSFSGDSPVTSAVLSDPFNLRTVVETGAIESGENTQFTATVTAAVPLPAAGWLMLAGIGGLAALRRRKRAA